MMSDKVSDYKVADHKQASDKSSDKRQSVLDKIDSTKDEITDHFEELELGKDEVLRVHAALEVARSAVASAAARPAHDLNDDLAEKPEDRPAVQGQGERPPIQRDDPVIEARERRVKEQEENPAQNEPPRAPLPG